MLIMGGSQRGSPNSTFRWSGEGFLKVCPTGFSLGGRIWSTDGNVQSLHSTKLPDMMLSYCSSGWLVNWRSLLPRLIKTYFIASGRKLAGSRSSSSWVLCDLGWVGSKWSNWLLQSGEGGPPRGHAHGQTHTCGHMRVLEVLYTSDYFP